MLYSLLGDGFDILHQLYANHLAMYERSSSREAIRFSVSVGTMSPSFLCFCVCAGSHCCRRGCSQVAPR